MTTGRRFSLVKDSNSPANPADSDSESPPQYSVSDFLVRASDVKGHSEPITTRYPPEMVAILEKTLASRVFPYTTIADIIRHAVSRHLEFLQTLDPSAIPVNSIKAHQIVNTIVKEADYEVQFTDTINRLQGVVDKMLQRGAQGEAARVVHEVLGSLDAMEDGYMKDTYKATVQERYQELIKSAPTVRLGRGRK